MRKYFSLDGANSAFSEKRLSIPVKNYQIAIEPIRSLWKKNKRKIILKLKFLNFPNTESAELQIYPGRRKGSDGTNEKPIPVSPSSHAPSLLSNTLIIGNSHVDLKKIFGKNIKKGDTGYFIFAPVLSSEYNDHLVFNIKVHIDRRIEVVDFGQSNPCPPAPPGGISKRKKKK